jgi:hypothetical protein
LLKESSTMNSEIPAVTNPAEGQFLLAALNKMRLLLLRSGHLTLIILKKEGEKLQ